MNAAPGYPTLQHEGAAEAVTHFFAEQPETDAVLLTCSLARGVGSPSSCVDVAVLVEPDVLALRGDDLKRRWQEFHDGEPAFAELHALEGYTHVDLDLFSGEFTPGPGTIDVPDQFELEIGNLVAYAAPLFERNDHFQRLRKRWLPYYDDELRSQRLAKAIRDARNNLDHIALFVERRLHFQAFSRLYIAYREFLWALFIVRRTYPIAYDKWIREQLVEILGMPDLYRDAVALLEIGRLESRELIGKADTVHRWLDAHFASAL